MKLCCDELEKYIENMGNDFVVVWSEEVRFVINDIPVPCWDRLRYCPFCGTFLRIKNGELVK